MSKTNGYLTLGIAAGIVTGTLVGLTIAVYIKSRRRRSRYAKEYHIENINA
jgi:hypothetical protein